MNFKLQVSLTLILLTLLVCGTGIIATGNYFKLRELEQEISGRCVK